MLEHRPSRSRLSMRSTAKGAASWLRPCTSRLPVGLTPQPGGCLSPSGMSTPTCARRTWGLSWLGDGGSSTKGLPGRVRPNRVTPPMMHVWFVPVPGSPAAIDASDAAIVRAARQSPRMQGTARPEHSRSGSGARVQVGSPEKWCLRISVPQVPYRRDARQAPRRPSRWCPGLFAAVGRTRPRRRRRLRNGAGQRVPERPAGKA